MSFLSLPTKRKPSGRLPWDRSLYRSGAFRYSGAAGRLLYAFKGLTFGRLPATESLLYIRLETRLEHTWVASIRERAWTRS